MKGRGVLRAIVTATHRKQEHVHTESLGKRKRHGDRATLARIVWCLLVHGLVGNKMRMDLVLARSSQVTSVARCAAS